MTLGNRHGVLSFADYYLACVANHRKHPEWRWGQTLFNTLYELKPELANSIRGTELDPFYVGDADAIKLAKFADHIQDKFDPDSDTM